MIIHKPIGFYYIKLSKKLHSKKLLASFREAFEKIDIQILDTGRLDLGIVANIGEYIFEVKRLSYRGFA